MIVVTNAAGQLCNRLLLLAHAYATGLETNQNTVHLVAADIQKEIQLSGRLLKVLGINTKPLHDNYEAVMSKLYGADFRKRNRDKMDQKRAQLSKKGIHILNNWYYRDYASLFKHRQEIVSAFAPVEVQAAKVEAFLAGIKEKYPDYTLVGVHIRRGDYRSWKNGKFFFDNATFARWMEELEKSLPAKTLFLVFSNEPVALEDFGACSSKIIKGPDHPIQDLYVMAQCDYIFGPPSSYSWWAAFYGAKKYLTVHSKDQHLQARDFAVVQGEEFAPERYEESGKAGTRPIPV